MAAARRVLERYSAVDGGLLANGLAYAALFAIIPSVLLAAALAGLLIHDPAQRASAVAVIGSVMPPLREISDTILADASRDVGALGLIGLATIVWSVSRFVLTLTNTVSRVIGRTERGGLVTRNAAAILAVALLALAIVGAPTLAGAASFLDTAEASGALVVVSVALHLALGAAPPIVTIVAIALVYRLVPTPSPSWSATWPPGLVVGIAETVLVQVFVFLAPRLIGAAALLGTIAAVFAALAWLSLSFQALLLGAAWVAERDAGRRAAATIA